MPSKNSKKFIIGAAVLLLVVSAVVLLGTDSDVNTDAIVDARPNGNASVTSDAVVTDSRNAAVASTKYGDGYRMPIAEPSANQQKLTYGPAITWDQLRAYTLADVGIGMTTDEAKGALEAKGFTGTFQFDTDKPDAQGAYPLNSGTSVFTGAAGVVLIKTVRDAAGVQHVWALQYQERSPAKLDHDAWVAQTKERFGAAPSRVASGGPSANPWQQVIYSPLPLPPSPISREMCGDVRTNQQASAPYGTDRSCANLRSFDGIDFNKYVNFTGLSAYQWNDQLFTNLGDYRYAQALNMKVNAGVVSPQ